MALLRRLAALRPGPITSTLASANTSLRSVARRWLALDAEIEQHDVPLATLTAVGDNPERIHSEAAFAKLCGACPIPASRGKTNRHRLNRGGNRQANAALYRVVITRMRAHTPTVEKMRRRKAEGNTKADIVRCLKRYVARETHGYLCVNPNLRNTSANTP